ncbi:hypothetical protein D3C79_827450 [compost metagenome]
MRRQYCPGHVFQPFQANAVDQRLAPHHQAGGNIAMAAEVLGRRMHHQVRPKLQRPLQIRRAVGVIDHHKHITALHCLDDGRYIHQLHVGIGRRFEVDHPRFAVNRRFQCLGIVKVDMVDLDSELADAMVQEREGAAI